ncbi:MAG: ATPase domain-containing protein [Candidatus Anstonellales archaeon]
MIIDDDGNELEELPLDPVLAKRAEHLEKLKEMLIKTIEAKRKNLALEKSNVKNFVNLGIDGIEKIAYDMPRRNSIIILNGPFGSGMTIFALKFLYHGITKENENGIYISFDEGKESILNTAKVFGMDFYDLERQKKFIFLEYPYNELNHFDDKDSVIKDFIDTINAQRLVIDCITPFMILHENEFVLRKRTKELFERLKSWNCTTFMIAENLTIEEANRNPFVKLADGFIQFYFEKTGNKRKREIEITKLRGCRHSYETFEFEIDQKFGIKILGKENEKLVRRKR